MSSTHRVQTVRLGRAAVATDNHSGQPGARDGEVRVVFFRLRAHYVAATWDRAARGAPKIKLVGGQQADEARRCWGDANGNPSGVRTMQRRIALCGSEVVWRTRWAGA